MRTVLKHNMSLLICLFLASKDPRFFTSLGFAYAKSVATVAGLVTEPITAAADNVVLEAEQFLEGGWITKWDLTIT